MSREAEERIAAVAAEQHGVVTRRQLLELGLSPAAVGRRLKSGRLRQVHRGVYLVGSIAPERATEMAAVLAGGPGAILSHLSALSILGMLRVGPRRPVHVSVPGNGRGRRPGIRFHRVPPFDGDELTVMDGVPVTSPTRTLADVTGMLGSREIEVAASVAERNGLIGIDELVALPDRYPRRPGISVLRRLLKNGRGPDFTRSEAERRCLELLRTAGLPRPYTNVSMGPYELDLFWPDEGIAVEVDGRAHHSSRPRFEGDRRKDMWLRARGIEVIRLSWNQITREGTATAVQLGQSLALARARRPGASTPYGVQPVVAVQDHGSGWGS
jgi:very-short-patch-repair endonuclease